MKRKKPQPEPDVIRFAHTTERLPQSFTITGLSEGDIRRLLDGSVPEWLTPTLAFWLRDNPKPSDVPPIDPREEAEAVGAVARSAG